MNATYEYSFSLPYSIGSAAVAGAVAYSIFNYKSYISYMLITSIALLVTIQDQSSSSASLATMLLVFYAWLSSILLHWSSVFSDNETACIAFLNRNFDAVCLFLLLMVMYIFRDILPFKLVILLGAGITILGCFIFAKQTFLKTRPLIVRQGLFICLSIFFLEAVIVATSIFQ